MIQMHLAELSGGGSKHHGIIYQVNLATTACQVLASDPFFSAFFHHFVNEISWWYFCCFILFSEIFIYPASANGAKRSLHWRMLLFSWVINVWSYILPPFWIPLILFLKTRRIALKHLCQNISDFFVVWKLQPWKCCFPHLMQSKERLRDKL